MKRAARRNARLRADAVAAGERHYRTGTPCRHGHDAPRYAANGECVACVREQHRRWRERHAEKAERILRRHLIQLGDRRKGPMV